MKQVLITGGNGMLAEYFKQYSTLPNLLFSTKKELDVTDKKKVKDFFSSHDISSVIHLAAATDVDWCEQHHIEARMINTIGTKNIVSICKKKNIPLVFTSTSAVFLGNREKAFTEKDIPYPANYYAKTKLEAEEIIQKELEKYTIIRLGWLIGKKKKFLSYILKQIQSNVSEIKAVSDIRGTITYAYDAVKFIDYVVLHPKKGIYHLASKGTCSRYDLTKKITKLAKSSIPVIPVSNNIFMKKFFAPRPKNESIVTVRKIKGYSFPKKWQQTLGTVEKIEGLI